MWNNHPIGEAQGNLVSPGFMLKPGDLHTEVITLAEDGRASLLRSSRIDLELAS